MAKLTGRDYKGHQRRGLQVRGLREFSYGAVSGVVVTCLAFAYVSGRLHKLPRRATRPTRTHIAWRGRTPR